MQLLFRISSMVAIGWRTAVRDPQWVAIGVGVSLLMVFVRTRYQKRTTTKILQSLSLTLFA
ncbi:MAG: hypothetical protein H6766_05915 [Candidatus Peribacteria bacterium]|nr:MAG: hypothetical protein H6766_05915 [Candidatus Peribacteria bacterium]